MILVLTLRAILDGDRFPFSCKKHRCWCSFIFLHPEERSVLWGKGRNCLVGHRGNNYFAFMKQIFVLWRKNYRTFLGHTHPQIPKSAVSTKRSWQSEMYQRARSNAAGHRKNTICNGPIRRHQAWKWIFYFFQVYDEDIRETSLWYFPPGFSARWKGVWIIFNKK